MTSEERFSGDDGDVPVWGRLSWRYDASRADRLAWLQTDNGETVADLSRGRAAGGYYARIFAPLCWIIESDPQAMAARDSMGQAAVIWWTGPHRTRKAAVAALLLELDRRSIGLFGLDTLAIETWRPA